MKQYRNNGAIGALLDEYEKALNELKDLIRPLTTAQLTTIVDAETDDDDCRSIQTILRHVVQSGHNYVVVIRQWKGEQIERFELDLQDSIPLYINYLDKLLTYNEQLFTDYPTLPLEEFDETKKIHVRWGQKYDVEQLFEHAIVHILRHRRQIERFLEKLSKHGIKQTLGL